MIDEIVKHVKFAKSHSNVDDAKGACILKGKKLLVTGFSRLPLHYHYTSEESPQHPELHISAVQDVIMKIGSYRKVSYTDLDIAVSEKPTLPDLVLIAEMGFKKLWILGDEKAYDPCDYLHDVLYEKEIKF